MSAITDNHDENTPQPVLRDSELVKMPRCTRCNLTYIPAKSTSALRLTYCSFLCELGDLGFSIVGLEHMQLQKKPVEPATAPEPEPLAID